MVIMTQTTLDLGNATFTNPKACVQATLRASGIVNTDSPSLVKSLRKREPLTMFDHWFLRTDTVPISIHILFDAAVSAGASDDLTCAKELTNMLRTCQLWAQIGYDVSLAKCWSEGQIDGLRHFIIDLLLIDKTSRRILQEEKQVTYDLRNVYPTGPIPTCKFSSISISLEFTPAKREKMVFPDLDRTPEKFPSKNGKGSDSCMTRTSVVKQAIFSLFDTAIRACLNPITPNRFNIQVDENNDLLGLMNVVPAIFMPNYPKQVTHTAKIIPFVNKFLTAYIRCAHSAAEFHSEITSHNVTNDDIQYSNFPDLNGVELDFSAHLWMSMHRKTREKGLARKIPRFVPSVQENRSEANMPKRNDNKNNYRGADDEAGFSIDSSDLKIDPIIMDLHQDLRVGEENIKAGRHTSALLDLDQGSIYESLISTMNEVQECDSLLQVQSNFDEPSFMVHDVQWPIIVEDNLYLQNSDSGFDQDCGARLGPQTSSNIAVGLDRQITSQMAMKTDRMMGRYTETEEIESATKQPFGLLNNSFEQSIAFDDNLLKYESLCNRYKMAEASLDLPKCKQSFVHTLRDRVNGEDLITCDAPWESKLFPFCITSIMSSVVQPEFSEMDILKPNIGEEQLLVE